MKKRLFRLILLPLALTLMLAVGAAASAAVIGVHDINIMVKDKVFEPKDVNGSPVRVFAYNGTTYAPLRALAEAYGLEVGYSSALNCAYVTQPGVEPDLSGVTLGGAQEIVPVDGGGSAQLIVTPINIVVNGQQFKPKDATGASVPVFASGGTTYAPLRALAEAYGLEVGYDAARNLAYVTQPGGGTVGGTVSNEGYVQRPDDYFGVEAYKEEETKIIIRNQSQEKLEDYVDLLMDEFGFTLDEHDTTSTGNHVWKLDNDPAGISDVYISWGDNIGLVSIWDEDNFTFRDQGYRYGQTQQPTQTTTPSGGQTFAPAIQAPSTEGVIQLPALYFFGKLDGGVGLDGYFTENVTKDMAEDYVNLLTSQGFELRKADTDSSYRRWTLVRKGSGADKSDISVDQYYNDYGTISKRGNMLYVSLINDDYSFDDLGYRHSGGRVETLCGPRALEAYVLENGAYSNAGDGLLSVKSGQESEWKLNTWWESYRAAVGAGTLIVNGSELVSGLAVVGDYEGSTVSARGQKDRVRLYDGDGKAILSIDMASGTLVSGEFYTQSDLASGAVSSFGCDFARGGVSLNEEDLTRITIRPLWLDRSGKSESVVYLYLEFAQDGVTYSVEGLAAAPFFLETEAERWSDGDTSGGSSSSSSSSSTSVPSSGNDRCNTCFGTGQVNCTFIGCDNGEVECNVCDGDGGRWVTDFSTPQYDGVGSTIRDKEWERCSSCGGDGEQNCSRCGGDGQSDCPSC